MKRKLQSKKHETLYFARTDSSMWHDLIFPNMYASMFLRGRIKFCRPDGTPANTACAPSVLVAYSEQDFASLRNAWLKGAFLRVAGYERTMK